MNSTESSLSNGTNASSTNAEAIALTAGAATWAVFDAHVQICLITLAAGLVLGQLLQNLRKLWYTKTLEAYMGKFYNNLRCSKLWNLLFVVCLTMMCFLHVMRFEGQAYAQPLEMLELFGALMYTLEMLVYWIFTTAKGSTSQLDFFASYMALGCIITVSTMYRWFAASDSRFSFGFFASVRLAGMWFSWLTRKGNSRLRPTDHYVRFAMQFVGGVFAASSMVKEVETLKGQRPNYLNAAQPPEESPSAQRQWSVGASLYYMCVNTSKTGFGDLLPRSSAGQVVAIIATLYCVYLVGGVLLKLMRGMEQAAGGCNASDYSPRFSQKHIVVTGSPSFQVLRDFLEEIYHKENIEATENLNVVILYLAGQRKVIEQLDIFLSNPSESRKATRIWAVEGSALKASDLTRVRYKSCVAAYLLPNMFGDDLEKEDIGNVIRALTMKKQCAYIRILALLMKAENKESLISVGLAEADVVCMDELTSGFLGKAAEVPGFLCLASILCRTSREQDVTDLAAAPRWGEDYSLGLVDSLMEMDLSSAYHNIPFAEVCIDVMRQSDSQAFLIGLSEEPMYPSDKTNYLLFPSRYHRPDFLQDRIIKGIFIAKDRKDIKQSPPGKIVVWNPNNFMESEQDVLATQATTAARVVAEAGKEGWVRDIFVDRKDRQEQIDSSMKLSAHRRAAQGIFQRKRLTRVAVQDLMDSTDPKIFNLVEELPPDPDDPTAYKSTDPMEKAIAKRQAKAAKEVEDEQDDMDAEAAKEFDQGEAESARVTMVQVAKAEEGIQRRRLMDRVSRDEDDNLYGGPPAGPENTWASPKEPPESLLLMGGHVVMLALETELPDNKDDVTMDGGFKRRPLRPGRKIDVHHFVRSLRTGQRQRRPVIVVSARVPLDWAHAEQEGNVFLVCGRPLSTFSLHRAGLLQARSVVIQQRNCLQISDKPLVDAEATFALRLVESMFAAAGKFVPVITHLHLGENSSMLPETSSPPKVKGLLELMEKKNDDEDETLPKTKEELRSLPVNLQHRFASGLLFNSNLALSLMGNVLYCPSLFAVINAMTKAFFVTMPVPVTWRGLSFVQLCEYMLRKKNCMPMGLMRRCNCLEEMDYVDGMVENRRARHPEEPVDETFTHVASTLRVFTASGSEEGKKRWTPDEPPFGRYTLAMPTGYTYVLHHDGVLCIRASSTGR